jgi:serine/threonine-protein kinase
MPDDLLSTLHASLQDKYRVEREIGAGGMATVYLAHDLRHERKVALKVLRRDLAASLGPERFHREIRVAAALQHPHIVPLYDSGEASGLLYYVMPFVDGQSLRQRLLKEGELPIADAARILRDVADALATAHKGGVVHRDLKPENVMLSGRHALVTDFGVAKAVSESTGRQTLTTLGIAIGTPTYMAPEQALADPAVDHRADIYAFGVLAYELLAGRPPFAAQSPQQLLAAHVSQAAEPVTGLRPAIPPVLGALVMRCLEKRAADRWQSADELIPQLEAVLTPSGGMTPTTVTPARASRGRSPLRVALLAAGLLVAVAVSAFGIWRRGSARDPASAGRVVVAWFDNRSGDSSLADLGALAAEWITEGLARESMGQLIPFTEVAELMSGASPPAPRDLARRLNAGLLVTGSYYRRGDSVEYRAEIIETERNRLVANVGPIRGIPDQPAHLDSLFQQVAVAIGEFTDYAPTDSVTMSWQRPRNLAAWRAFQEAYRVFVVSQSRALEPAMRARELDPEWFAPLGLMWAIHSNAGRRLIADSIVTLAEAMRNKLPPVDRATLDYAKAVNDARWMDAHRAMLRAQSLAPRLWAYNAALSALRVGRPREALEFVRLRDTTWFAREWGGWNSVHRNALHFVGDFAEEARVAAEITRTRGQTLGTIASEVRALAAAGKTREVDSLVSRAWEMPATPTASPADVAGSAAAEYGAHGYERHAAPLFRRRAEWLQSRSPEQQAAHSGFRSDLANAFFDAGRYDEAFALFDSLSRAAPDNVGRHGMVGLTAVLLGDSARARGADSALAALTGPYLRAANTLWQSRIAAARGDCGRATDLLRRALATGQSYAYLANHRWTTFGRARDCAGLAALIAPTG